jgi:uncharacterized SAM-binding protein YcdF (DUF218 family)
MLFHKLLPVFVLPIGVTVLLVLLGLRGQWRWLGIVGVVVLVASSLPFVGNWALGRLEVSFAPVRIGEAPAVDAIYVLGGTMSTPSRGVGFLPNWGDAVERFEGGVQLMQAGKAPRLVFAGAKTGAGGDEDTEGAVMRRLAIERGVTADAIHLTDVVTNTADEARALVQIAQEQGWKRVLLVTSAWHLPRAMRQFQRAGVELVPFPVDYRSAEGAGVAREARLTDFLPSASGLGMTETALRECYGIAFYTVFAR